MEHFPINLEREGGEALGDGLPKLGIELGFRGRLYLREVNIRKLQRRSVQAGDQLGGQQNVRVRRQGG